MKKLVFLCLLFVSSLSWGADSCKVSATPPNYPFDGMYNLSCDANGNLRTTSGGGSGSQAVTGTAATTTDGSGTITTGGTSQQVFSANTSRKYLMVQNPCTATESLWVNLGAVATANNSIELLPCGSVTYDSTYMPSGTVNVLGATTAHVFIAKQG